MVRLLGALFVLAAGQLGSLHAETPADSELSPAEQELSELMVDYYQALETYWSAEDSYESEEAYEAALADGTIGDPNASYIPQLLAFEEEHRGQDVGLLALWHVFREAARGGESDSPTIVGRRQAATRLAAYTESDLLPTVTRTAMSGHYEPEVVDAVSKLIDAATVPPANRDMLCYYLAAESLEARTTRHAIAKRSEALRNGTDSRWPGELEFITERSSMLPAGDDLDARCEAAMQTLDELANDPASPRLRSPKGVGEHRYIIRVVEDSSQPLLAEKAAAELFKERHLKIGAVAPELEVKLLDETPWQMADQRGKVVVVQFSFTGCGPCEQMYPDLAALANEHGDRLAILTLMSDPTPESALDSQAIGKFTWNIALDGQPGRVATEWSVTGFPTIYVIDRAGKISAHDLRGDPLRNEVARLLEPTN